MHFTGTNDPTSADSAINGIQTQVSAQKTDANLGHQAPGFPTLGAPLGNGIVFATIGSNRNLYNPHMQGIPWSTIALGSLLLISAYSTGGQEVQSPQSEKSKPPLKTEQRGRILGIGGVFFKSANRDQTREWYSKHLG